MPRPEKRSATVVAPSRKSNASATSARSPSTVGWRKRHRNVAKPNGKRLGLPACLRAKPAVDRKASQGILTRKVQQSFRRGQPIGLDTLQRTIDALIDQRQFHIDRLPAAITADQFSQWLDQGEKLGHEDMAFLHVHNSVRSAFAETQHGALRGLQRMQGSASARPWRRQLRREYFSNREILSPGGSDDPVCHELP